MQLIGTTTRIVVDEQGLLFIESANTAHLLLRPETTPQQRDRPRQPPPLIKQIALFSNFSSTRIASLTRSTIRSNSPERNFKPSSPRPADPIIAIVRAMLLKFLLTRCLHLNKEAINFPSQDYKMRSRHEVLAAVDKKNSQTPLPQNYVPKKAYYGRRQTADGRRQTAAKKKFQTPFESFFLTLYYNNSADKLHICQLKLQFSLSWPVASFTPFRNFGVGGLGIFFAAVCRLP